MIPDVTAEASSRKPGRAGPSRLTLGCGSVLTVLSFLHPCFLAGAGELKRAEVQPCLGCMLSQSGAWGADAAQTPKPKPKGSQRVSVSSEVWSQALAVWAQMELLDLKDQRSYALLIDACRGRARLVPGFVQKAESKGFRLSRGAYCEALRTQQRASQWQQMLLLLSSMEAMQVVPDALMCEIALRPFGKVAFRAWEYGVALLRRAEQRDLHLDGAAYMHLVRACKKCQIWSQASLLLISRLGYVMLRLLRCTAAFRASFGRKARISATWEEAVETLATAATFALATEALPETCSRGLFCLESGSCAAVRQDGGLTSTWRCGLWALQLLPGPPPAGGGQPGPLCEAALRHQDAPRCTKSLKAQAWDLCLCQA